jgi:hypothetical protein
MPNLSARLTRLEETSGSSAFHVVEIDGWLEGDAAHEAIEAALAAKGIAAKQNDLVVALRRFGGTKRDQWTLSSTTPHLHESSAGLWR